MKALLSIEFRKALLHNKWFFLVLGFGCIVALTSGFVHYTRYLNDSPMLSMTEKYFLPQSVISFFNYGIINGPKQSVESLFFILLPLLAVMPYVWSLSNERSRGYSSHLIVRSSKAKYLLVKYIVVACSSMLVLLIPLLLNLVLCMCFAPFIAPDVRFLIFFGISEPSLWSEIFYTNPALYCVLRVCLIELFAGIWSIFVLSVSLVVKKPLQFILLPYMALLLLEFLSKGIFWYRFGITEGFTPFAYLSAIQTEGFRAHEPAIILSFLFLILASTGLLIFNKKKDTL